MLICLGCREPMISFRLKAPQTSCSSVWNPSDRMITSKSFRSPSQFIVQCDIVPWPNMLFAKLPRSFSKRYAPSSISSPLPLEVLGRTQDRHTLIHDGLAHPQIVLNPLLDARRLGEGFCFQTGPGVVRFVRGVLSQCKPRVGAVEMARLWSSEQGKQ